MSRNQKPIKLSNAQRETMISQFQSLTGANQQDAAKALKRHNYNINNAVDQFFTNPNPAVMVRDNAVQRLAALFDQYRDPDGDKIGIDGTIRLCQDLGVQPEDVVLLAIAYELKCPGVGEFLREDWIQGLQGIGVNSIESFKRQLGPLRTRLLTDPEYFKKVYVSTFAFAKPPDSRVMPLESAIDYQRLLIVPALGPGKALASQSPPGFTDQHFEGWVEYLEQSKAKAMTKDVWNQFIDFVRQIDSGFLTHDMDGAWPSAIDDFVLYARKRAAEVEEEEIL